MGVCGAYCGAASAQGSSKGTTQSRESLRRGLVDSPAICDVQGVGVVLYSGGTDALNARAFDRTCPNWTLTPFAMR